MKKGFVKTLSKSAADIRLFPLKNVLRRYDKHKLGCDLKAGAGVAMLSFSMSIAYAMIAGLPIKYGLFGCIAAAAVSGVFSSSRFIMFGPSNASAVMLMSAFASLGLVTEEQRAGAAAAIVLLVGVFLALASVFKITNLARYISRTVVTGYITAGAMLIIANQSANALGISGIKNSGGKFIATSEATLRRLDEANWQAVAVAAAAVITLFACKKFFKKLPAQAMALIVPSAICALIGLFRELDLAYINSISVSDWGITLPNFEAAPIRSVVFASAAVAMFCVIESTSIGKSLAAKSAERLNTNQEIFSLGLANI
ncbi:MAG: SulP family inorganic anion transporter, partial [Opitutales bacterium]|nr:SulP family inorganic anion transporter [Opitutales bacterium]